MLNHRLKQQVLTTLGISHQVKSIKSLNQNVYVDEPRLDMLQWVARSFSACVRKSIDTALLLYLANNYTEEELRNLPISAISHLVDVRFIRDADGGIGYEIRPKLKTIKI